MNNDSSVNYTFIGYVFIIIIALLTCVGVLFFDPVIRDFFTSPREITPVSNLISLVVGIVMIFLFIITSRPLKRV